MRAERALRLATMMALAAVAWPACSSPKPPPVTHSIALAPDEIALRKRLGVPLDAQRVMVFGQTAHLDIDWQKTFDGYYTSFVGDIFLDARKLLEAQPRAFYSVAEMAYLEHHLSVHPDELASLVAASKRGALRVVGGGMTSPDTLLPETELLARDFLYGIQFAEDTLDAHPRSAWLPDSFGHAATAPDILAAAGYDSVAFARVDGAPGLFDELFHPGLPFLPGSTAETLQKLGSADFTWRGVGGKSVLAHFMAGAGLYCEGDNIDYAEGIQVPGAHVGDFHGDEPAFTDDRIDGYAAELTPFAKTPYLFVPVGCDFQRPKDGLLGYLDGYNQRRYPATHVWAVAAPFEDYATLVGFQSDQLPVVSGDLTPYYMGFYGSRAGVKRATRDAARDFFVAETFATAIGDDGLAIVKSAAPALKKLTRANHHDFITGTSADAVVSGEQLPLLEEARLSGATELTKVASAIARRIPLTSGATRRVLALNASSADRTDVADFQIPIVGGAVPALHAVAGGKAIPMDVVGSPAPSDTTATLRVAFEKMPSFSWQAIDLLPGAAGATPTQVKLERLDAMGTPVTGKAVARVVVSNAHVRARWDRDGARFALTSLQVDGAEAIAHPSLLVRDYHDTGGLWRLGHEMAACEFTPLPPSGDVETVQVLDESSLMVRVAFRSSTETREAWLGAGATGLSLAVTTGAKEATTRTVSFSFGVAPDAKLHTSSPAGWVERPLERLYSPTFWPAVAWTEVGGWAVLLRQSTGVRMSTPGELELYAARDARSEKCDVEGGAGSDAGTHRVEWRIERIANAAGAERAAQAFNRPVVLEAVSTAQALETDLPAALSLAQIEGDGIVSALKPAERGDGVILRVLLMPGPASVHLWAGLLGKQVTIVDLAERDGREVGAAPDPLVFDPASYGSIASVRVH